MMQQPSLASLSMFSKCIAENGISRGNSISLPCSLIVTSAARCIRLLLLPLATADSVDMEQGIIIMVLAALDPDAAGLSQSSLK